MGLKKGKDRKTLIFPCTVDESKPSDVLLVVLAIRDVDLEKESMCNIQRQQFGIHSRMTPSEMVYVEL